MTALWWHGGMAALDTESTGVDVENDRVIQISFVIIRPTAPALGDRVVKRTELINPGVPVPDEAAAVHGYTTERLQAEGGDPATVLDVFAADIALAIVAGLPLVIMNAPFDLTLIDRDCRRHGVPTIVDRLDGRPLAPVIDPLTLDKQLVKKRRRVSETQGARQLKTLCQVWQVGGRDPESVHWDDAMAHAAEYDAMQVARVVWRMCADRRVGVLSPMELHHRQVKWAHEQAIGLADWFRSEGKHEKAATVSTDWPMRPFISHEQEKLPA